MNVLSCCDVSYIVPDKDGTGGDCFLGGAGCIGCRQREEEDIRCSKGLLVSIVSYTSRLVDVQRRGSIP
jgi:hypothetical protein